MLDPEVLLFVQSSPQLLTIWFLLFIYFFSDRVSKCFCFFAGLHSQAQVTPSAGTGVTVTPGVGISFSYCISLEVIGTQD